MIVDVNERQKALIAIHVQHNVDMNCLNVPTMRTQAVWTAFGLDPAVHC